MPLLLALLPFLRKYSTQILIAWVVLAALWYTHHSGYKKAKTEQAQEIAQAKIIAREKEKTANEELQKIADDYINDIAYGVYSIPAGVSDASRIAIANTKGGGCQQSRAYRNKLLLVKALDLIIQADRKLVNGR